MGIQIDLIADFAARCRQRLTEAGYDTTSADDRENIRSYLNIRHRRVKNVPRTFHQGPYTAPPKLAAGQAMLKKTVEDGGDLWPHQSRKITKSAKEDDMLNDFGIQHFILVPLLIPVISV